MEQNGGAIASEIVTTEADQDTSAPTTDVTAAPAEGEVTPEAKPEKVFNQQELEAEIGKRLAKAERKAKREMDTRIAEIMARQQAPEQKSTPPDARPLPDKFTSTEDYVEAVAEWKAKEILKAERQQFETKNQEEAVQRHAADLNAEYLDRVEEATKKYDDFEEVTRNPRLAISPIMADAIRSSDIGTDVAYFLGINPKEAERISRLSPLLQVKEIGRLEAKVLAEPPAKKTSSAPAPITPVKPRGTSPARSTLDPKSLGEMGTSAWIKAEEDRMRKKWAAEHR